MALLALGAAAAVLGFLLARRHDRAVAESGGQYVCPMHPEIAANGPKDCPICGMALVKVGVLARESSAAPEQTAEVDDEMEAAQMLSGAAGGVAPGLVGYSPTPVRRRIVRQEPLAPAWLEGSAVAAALLYRDRLQSLVPDEQAWFYSTSDPTTEIELRLLPEPPKPWDRSMSVVRFSVMAKGKALPPQIAGWVKLTTKPRESLVVPSLAVLQSSEGPYVLVFSPARGTVAKRFVETGRVFSGFTAVATGLSARELVVSMNAFFWDAERRFRAEQRAGGGAGP